MLCCLSRTARHFLSDDCKIFPQISRFTKVYKSPGKTPKTHLKGINFRFKVLNFESLIYQKKKKKMNPLSQFLLAILFFHSSEYILAVFIHGKSKVSLSSLLVSKEYALAMVISLVEYFVEVLFFPGLKEHLWVSNLGLAMVVIGEIVRKLAIVTAGRSFTHLIKVYHEEHHKLVTTGIYALVRHPSYCGFFIWSVGTQIMLCNPISTIGFAVVVWRFFAKRIPYEEFFLRQFFGADYEEYARRVPSGVPFVK